MRTQAQTIRAATPRANSTANYFEGNVLKSDGITAAEGVIVYFYLQHSPTSSPVRYDQRRRRSTADSMPRSRGCLGLGWEAK
mgnify:CR=1 FL=1